MPTKTQDFVQDCQSTADSKEDNENGRIPNFN